MNYELEAKLFEKQTLLHEKEIELAEKQKQFDKRMKEQHELFLKEKASFEQLQIERKKILEKKEEKLQDIEDTIKIKELKLEYENQIQKLQSQLKMNQQEHQKKIDEFNQQQQLKFQLTINNLENQIDNLKEQLDIQNKANLALEIQVEQLEAQQNKKMKELEDIRQQKIQFENRAKELHDKNLKIELFQIELEKKNQELIKSQRDASSALVLQNDSSRDINQQFKEQSEKYKNTKKKLKKERQESEKIINELKQQIRQQHNDVFITQNQSGNDQDSKMNISIIEKQHQAQAQQKDQVIQIYKNEIKQQQDKVQEQQNQLSIVNEEVYQLEQQLIQETQSKESFKNISQNLQLQLQKNQQNYEEQRRLDLQTFQDESNKKQFIIENQQRQIKEMDLNFQLLTKEFQRMKLKLNQIQYTKVRDLQRNLAKLNDENLQLKMKLQFYYNNQEYQQFVKGRHFSYVNTPKNKQLLIKQNGLKSLENQRNQNLSSQRNSIIYTDQYSAFKDLPRIEASRNNSLQNLNSQQYQQNNRTLDDNVSFRQNDNYSTPVTQMKQNYLSVQKNAGQVYGKKQQNIQWQSKNEMLENISNSISNKYNQQFDKQFDLYEQKRKSPDFKNQSSQIKDIYESNLF